MTKRKMLIVDVDDTVIEWSPMYVTWLFRNHLNEIDTHNSTNWFTNKKWIAEFNNESHEFYKRKRIEPMCKLVEHYIGKVFVLFLSACGEKAYDRQQSMLQRHITYIGWEFDTCESSHEKIEALKNFNEHFDLFVLDDKVETVTELNKLGIRATSSSDTELVRREIDKWRFDNEN